MAVAVLESINQRHIKQGKDRWEQLQDWKWGMEIGEGKGRKGEVEKRRVKRNRRFSYQSITSRRLFAAAAGNDRLYIVMLYIVLWRYSSRQRDVARKDVRWNTHGLDTTSLGVTEASKTYKLCILYRRYTIYRHNAFRVDYNTIDLTKIFKFLDNGQENIYCHNSAV